MQFEFTTTSKIIFGSGKINTIYAIVQEFDNRVLIISGVPQEISNKLQDLLDMHGVICSFLKIEHEPTVDVISEIVGLASKYKPTVIVGIGGGSTLDSAKATAVLVTNPGDVLDYLEVIGQNKPLINPALPLIVIPTTSGTGSEVTKNAVIGSPKHHLKVSLRSPHLLPRVALIDPELTITVPPSVTAVTGLDALTQLIEPYTCNSPNPLIDALCLAGIERVAHSLFRVYDNGVDLSAREDMSLAALFSGLALANARLGAVHGLAGPIGGEINAPHGAICARLLPAVLATNISALRNRSPDHPVLERYAVIGKLLSGSPSANADSGIQWIQNFCSHSNIRPLSSFGLTEDSFTGIIEKAMKASSMKGNPIILTAHDLRSILHASM